MKRILAIIRANDWWEYKFPPMLAVVYMIILNSTYSFLHLLPLIAVSTIAIILGAIYVSLLNDATDIQEDAIAGKKNGMSAFPVRHQAILVLAPLAASLVLTAMYPGFPRSAILFYIAAYISFTVYSLPPFRLKSRGSAGIIADALGSQVFPTLFLSVSFYQQTKQEIQVLPFVFLGIWTCCFGLRGILWHQLSDKQHDKVSGLVTAVQQINEEQLSRLGVIIIIAEMIAFAVYIQLNHQLLLIIPGLLVYFGYNLLLQKRLHVKQILINPEPGQYRIFLFEYYQFFLPLSVLVICACKHPVNIAGLIFHCFLFRTNARDIWCSMKRIFENNFTNTISFTKKNRSN